MNGSGDLLSLSLRRHFSALSTLVVCAAITLDAGPPQALAVQFYVLSETDPAMYRVDSENLGVPTLVGAISTGTRLYEVLNPGDGTLLTFDRDTNTIITLSAADASVQSVVSLDQDLFVSRRGFDFDSSGILYGVLPGMQLRTVDPATGQTSLIANITGAARVEALAFGPDDTLYATGSAGDDSNSENLYTLNTATGQLTLIGATGFADVDTLTFAPDGFLYGANARAGITNELLRISPITAEGTELGDAGVVGFSGIAVVAEPGSGVLLVSALVALVSFALVQRARHR